MEQTVLDSFDLTGRVAIVTGGGGLLGREFCKTLLNVGATVVAVDRSESAAESAFKGVDEAGIARAVPLACDISVEGEVEGLVSSVVKAAGRVDILVNSAAIDPKFDPESRISNQTSFEQQPLANWCRSLDVNITGAFLCCREVGKAFLSGKGGVIVNVASTYGLVAPDQRLYQRDGEEVQTQFKPAAYPVTKAALLQLTRYLAVYWGQANIRVNSLTPHGVFNGHDDQFVRRFSERSPMGRMARKDEFNSALLFLVSDASTYMTGANLVLDGGWTAW